MRVWNGKIADKSSLTRKSIGKNKWIHVDCVVVKLSFMLLPPTIWTRNFGQEATFGHRFDLKYYSMIFLFVDHYLAFDLNITKRIDLK